MSKKYKKPKETVEKESDKVEMSGVVKDANKDFFRVECGTGEFSHIVICRPAGKLRKHSIKILVGDSVRIECSPYDLEQGRIVNRERAGTVANDT